jgi:WD40 repeat protein
MFSKKKKELKEAWNVKVDSGIVSSPIASNIDKKGDPLIVFGTKNGKLYALEDNSKVKWFYNVKQELDKLQEFFVDESEDNSIYAKPLIYDIDHDGNNEVVFGTNSGALICLDHTGKELWRFNTRGKILATPLAYEKEKETMFVVPTTLGKLIWLNSKGKIREELSFDSGIESTPNLFTQKGKNKFVCGTNSGELVCINEKKEIEWKFKTKGKITSRPIISALDSKDEIYLIFGSHDGNLYCLDSKGNQRWKFKTDDKIVSEAALVDFNKDGIPEIVFCSYDSGVYALNANGDLLWNYKTDFWIEASPIIADIDNDGKMEVVVGSYDHSLYILDAQGSFLLNYVPGVSVLANQTGQVGDLVTSDPGHYKGKKLFNQNMGGIIVGTDLLIDKKKNKWIIVAIKNGKISKVSIK